jgi:hypothetical protein
MWIQIYFVLLVLLLRMTNSTKNNILPFLSLCLNSVWMVMHELTIGNIIVIVFNELTLRNFEKRSKITKFPYDSLRTYQYFHEIVFLWNIETSNDWNLCWKHQFHKDLEKSFILQINLFENIEKIPSRLMKKLIFLKQTLVDGKTV